MSRNAALVVAVAACSPLWCYAQQPKSFSSEVLKQVTAEVESVDHDARKLVLRAEDDARTLVIAGPQVGNLEQINEGDRVVASYRVAIAADVKPKGEGVQGVKQATATARAPEGASPGAGAGSVIATTVAIEAVDTSFDTVTFTRQDGITRTVAVEDPGAQAFIRELKRGDEVQVMYTEAVAVNLQPAQ
jgi:Cu/Ag efflux protein CusF